MDDSLFSFVYLSQGACSEKLIKWVLLQVAKGVQAMHAKNILHRDIKSDNVLCRFNGEVKLADMGLAAFLT